MATVQINEKTKIGKNVLEMLKALAKDHDSIRFLDETELLLSSEANKDALLHGISQVQEGKSGKNIKPADLWK